jgi:hypothetical protein
MVDRLNRRSRFKLSEVLHDTAPWTLLGLAVVLLSGPILFLSDVRMYLHNPSFV